jgi:hypothetical protein
MLYTDCELRAEDCENDLFEFVQILMQRFALGLDAEEEDSICVERDSRKADSDNLGHTASIRVRNRTINVRPFERNRVAQICNRFCLDSSGHGCRTSESSAFIVYIQHSSGSRAMERETQ